MIYQFRESIQFPHRNQCRTNDYHKYLFNKAPGMNKAMFQDRYVFHFVNFSPLVSPKQRGS